ncbi:cell division protein FtsQ/DivIB [Bacteroidales bacterium OttesenSCG-928-L03]|nr:cell division protein FtsQ/DivIB [Bacteroidales bacterium OttesenSCG-928-L03]
MIKRILLISVACLLVGYMLFALFFISPKASQETLCNQMDIRIVYRGDQAYFTEEEIRSQIEKAKLNPVGKIASEINTGDIEAFLRKNKLVKEAECYKTMSGSVKVMVSQRTPILRVMSPSEDYYIDEEGTRMPVPRNFAAYVPLATGYIDEEYAQNELLELVSFLDKHDKWNKEIEQIYIHRNKDIEVSLRKGNHLVLLGKLEQVSENLEKLNLFYEKGLNKIGWNRYKLINLKYKDRVICTRN